MTGTLGTGSVVDQALRTAAAARPSAEGLVINPGSAGSTFAWQDLEQRTAQLAEHIEGFAAIRANGPCAVEAAASRTASALLWLVAALRTDLPVVLVDASAPDEELDAARSRLHGLGIGLVRRVSGEDMSCPASPLGYTPAVAQAGPEAVLPRHSLVLASGGSTGQPKLVVDRSLRRRVTDERFQVTGRIGWHADQTQLVIGRLHHAAPFTFFLRGLIDGNRIVVPSRYASSIAVRLIEEQRVGWIQATPFQLQQMAAWLREHPADLSSLRGVLHMSAPCPPSVKRYWIDRISAERVFEIYGATEGLGLTVATGAEWLSRPGTVGKGFFTQIRILDEGMRPMPARTVGAVFLRNLAASSAPGYLGDADRLRTSPDGFRSVDDRGFLDEDGYLYIEPRRTHVINVAGENVYPAEVEAVLVRHQGVVDAAVTGVPDDRLGARPVAFVACWPGVALNEREAIGFCRERLSAFKVPKRIWVVAQIPHTPAGKIDRMRVAEMLSAYGAAGRFRPSAASPSSSA